MTINFLFCNKYGCLNNFKEYLEDMKNTWKKDEESICTL